jgi:hypothetical protein
MKMRTWEGHGGRDTQTAMCERIGSRSGATGFWPRQGLMDYDSGESSSSRERDVRKDHPKFCLITGCVLSCRPIGVIEGEQSDNNNKERNDRILAVQKDAHVQIQIPIKWILLGY